LSSEFFLPNKTLVRS